MGCCLGGIRRTVSQEKRRYQQDGFDLDLVYISAPRVHTKGKKRIVAMGFPSTGFEAIYRNPYREVEQFLRHYHNGHYKVYNLCIEMKHQYRKGCDFGGRYENFPMYDHNPADLQLVAGFCDSVHGWLANDDDNIVAVHCKAGKGRTGMMVCCYILYSEVGLDQPGVEASEAEFVSIAEECMRRYGEERTKNGKGVTIASQKRYVRYWGRVLWECWERREQVSQVDDSPITSADVNALLESIPFNRQALIVSITVVGLRYHPDYRLTLQTSLGQDAPATVASPSPTTDPENLTFPFSMLFRSNVRLALFKSPSVHHATQELFHVWFHIGFENKTKIHFTTQELDIRESPSNASFCRNAAITIHLDPDVA
eukprot:TRINITY_DN6814_c0_g1_i1.p1 TRINITY_DN6814_c0_g1~~TRINITY_DN6814_c0_g1_i1.p1  ORF type:complete len:390 (+),score=26.85 TRINITY_DN6814_c0_g1_i1:65-1171(+)